MKKNLNKIIVPVNDMKEVGRLIKTLGLEIIKANYIGTLSYSWIIKGSAKYNMIDELKKVCKEFNYDGVEVIR